MQCPECKGKRKVRIADPNDPTDTIVETCPTCGGIGDLSGIELIDHLTVKDKLITNVNERWQPKETNNVKQ